jgi:hypothetical protein
MVFIKFEPNNNSNTSCRFDPLQGKSKHRPDKEIFNQLFQSIINKENAQLKNDETGHFYALIDLPEKLRTKYESFFIIAVGHKRDNQSSTAVTNVEDENMKRKYNISLVRDRDLILGILIPKSVPNLEQQQISSNSSISIKKVDKNNENKRSRDEIISQTNIKKRKIISEISEQGPNKVHLRNEMPRIRDPRLARTINKQDSDKSSENKENPTEANDELKPKASLSNTALDSQKIDTNIILNQGSAPLSLLKQQYLLKKQKIEQETSSSKANNASENLDLINLNSKEPEMEEEEEEGSSSRFDQYHKLLGMLDPMHPQLSEFLDSLGINSLSSDEKNRLYEKYSEQFPILKQKLFVDEKSEDETDKNPLDSLYGPFNPSSPSSNDFDNVESLESYKARSSTVSLFSNSTSNSLKPTKEISSKSVATTTRVSISTVFMQPPKGDSVDAFKDLLHFHKRQIIAGRTREFISFHNPNFHLNPEESRHSKNNALYELDRLKKSDRYSDYEKRSERDRHRHDSYYCHRSSHREDNFSDDGSYHNTRSRIRDERKRSFR